ncbi:hypothetical protein EO92_05490 [Methanosarcina sp. 2.H.A.1B.4]|nr:hypothetical protein EO92_05490 [Methanosarcina sp. 2.H.A.1B.4]
MIAKYYRNDVINKKNDVDFDVEVMDYVYKNLFVRREQLINHFIETHNGERGYTRPSIERKIARLTKNGSLIIVKQPELENYGIYDKDQRASYLTVKEIIDIDVYLDTLFSYFESNEKYDKNSILIEIDLYKDRYSFTGEQLDVLVDYLSTDNENLQFHIIQILKEYILERNIKPTNKEKLLKAVNETLGKLSGISKEHENYRTYLISILGYYNSDSVIDWLKYDLKNLNTNEKFFEIKKNYSDTHTVRIIDRHKLELFNLINDLKKEGKEEEARLVYNVKHEAAKALGYIIEKEDDSW